jgi:hypothetical protein
MKKQFYTVFLFLISFFGYCQLGPNDKAVYLDSLKNIGTADNYKFIRIIKDFNLKKDLYDVSDYFQSGKIERRGSSSNPFFMAYEGPCISYYENGNRKKIENYSEKQLAGKQFEWYENGNFKLESEIILDPKTNNSITKIIHFWNAKNEQKVIDGEGEYDEAEAYPMVNKLEVIHSKGAIKNYVKEGIWTGSFLEKKFNYTEEYAKGKLITGKSVDSLGINQIYNEIFTKPKPVRGFEDFYHFIGVNYRTPQQVSGLTGKIYLTFVIEKDGTFNDTKIIRDIGYGTGAEAIRVLSKYGYWKPGILRGVPIRVMYSLPITIQSNR